MTITEEGLPPSSTPMLRSSKRAPGALRELFAARELLANLTRRDLKVRHRGTFLGLLWSLATPLVTVGLYYFVFTIIFRTTPVSDLARPDGNDVPFAVYFFCGLTLWNFFGTSVASSTSSITGSGYLLNKVYFPRSVLPLSSVLSSLVTFGFEISVLLIVSLAVVGAPSLHLLWVPVILLVVGAFAVGVGLLLSAATVFLRDVAHFIGLLLQVWFWATPVIYSLGFVSSRSGPGVIRLLELNPLTGAVISFRNVVVLNHPPDFSLLAYDAVVGIVALAIGAYVFQRCQRLFSEMV